jgi:hypothetical protein
MMYLLEHRQPHTVALGRTVDNYITHRWRQHSMCADRAPLEGIIDRLVAGGFGPREDWRIEERPNWHD